MKKNKKKLLKSKRHREKVEIYHQFGNAFQSKEFTESYNLKSHRVNPRAKMTAQLFSYRRTPMNNIVKALINNIDDSEELDELFNKYITLPRQIISSTENVICIQKGTDFYRAVSNPTFITKPPACKTSIGRINFKNESVLYLAFSPQTAYLETKNNYILHFIAKKSFYAMLSYTPVLDKGFTNPLEHELDAYKNELCNRIFSLTPSKTSNVLSNEQIYVLTNKLKSLIYDPLIPALLYPSTKIKNNTTLSKNNNSSELLDCVIFENDEDIVTCIEEDTYKYKETYT